MTADRRETDAAKVSFPLQLVIVIVTAVVSVVTSNYATTSSMRAESAETRSDLRDIATRFDLYRDTMKANAATQDEKSNALGAKIDAATNASKAQVAAQDDKINGLKAAIEALSSSMKLSNDAITRRQDFQAIQISNFQDALAKLSQRKE